MSTFGRGTPFVSQPPYKPSVDPYWLSRGVILATSYGQVVPGVGAVVENLAGEFTDLAPIGGTLAGRTSNEIYSYSGIQTVTTPHGQAITPATADATGQIVTGDFAAGITEFTVLTWFVFNASAQSKQWINLRSSNNHSLDVFSQTSSSITWGTDWRTSWTGSAQKTLSGLKDGDLVCIAASVTSAGARQFNNGAFAGTKSGSAFTLPASQVYPTPGISLIESNAMAPGSIKSLGHVFANKALSDDELIYLTGNPWGLFRQRSRMPAPWIAGAATVTVDSSVGGAWSVRGAAASSLSGSWGVRALASGSASGGWSVRNLAGGAELPGAWSARNGIASALPGAWSVRSSAGASVPGAWSVRSASDASVPGGWSVRNAADGALSGGWSVRNASVSTLPGAWSVEAQAGIASASLQGAWSVRSESAAQVLSGGWSVRSAAASAVPGSWSVRNTIASTPLAGAWSLRNAATGALDGAWSVDTQTTTVSSLLSGAWGVSGYVGSALSGAWSVRGMPVAYLSGSWSVLGDYVRQADTLYVSIADSRTYLSIAKP